MSGTSSPLVDDLARLIALPSVSSQPNEALADWMAERCEAAGFQVSLLRSAPGKVNVIATAGPAGTDGLVLSGHMDVVPTEGQPWSSDPFVLTERHGLLYGRGTADMKGFLAATLHALREVRTADLHRELMLLWTCDEEIGCLGSAAIADDLLARGRPVPRACLIGEPTGFRVLRMHPGHVHVHIEVTGRAAHSSRPELGANAIETAADVIVECRALARELQEERADLPMPTPWVVLNVGRVQGGAAINIVPDRCQVELGYRPLPGTDDASVLRRLQARLEERFGAGACRVHARCCAVVPSLHTPPGTDLAAWLTPHAPDGVQSATFATDGGNLARAGMAPLVFGPGSIDVAHQADEHVAAADLHHAAQILRDLIGARCQA
jgi:acetylornithine deacetylase